MKITRRQLAATALGPAAGFSAARSLAQAPADATQPEDLNAAAREQLRKTAETLAKFDLPISAEPAFVFKV